jgi:subtilisin family serine protease
MIKKIRQILIISGVIFCLSGGFIRAGIDYRPNQLIVKLKARVSISVFPRLYGKIKDCVKQIQPGPDLKLTLLEFKENSPLEKIKESIRQEPYVEEVSFNYKIHIHEKTPDDPYFKMQYALKNSGQVFSTNTDPQLQGTPGADISAPDGWEWSQGTEKVIIAILDSGICEEHEDLIGKVIEGYNFYSDNSNTADDNGHGTFVASIAAAKTDNALGMAGVCWHALLLPVKVTDPAGDSDYLTVAAGIKYAADRGADIINISMGGKHESFILKDAIKYAFERGAIIIASTGNSAKPVEFPAAYDEYCLAIGATDENDLLAGFSNFGDSVDLVAPGANVLGAYFNPGEKEMLDQYALGNGTSFAVPMVAGAAAILKSYKPFLSNSTIMLLLKYTADDINHTDYPGVDPYMGYGRLNLSRLLGPVVLE